jgi:hypothetical protein
MPFALTLVRLEEALRKPGCAVCRIEHEAALNAVDHLLWEHTNDPQTRREVRSAGGFFPDHTRLLVAMELSRSGPTLGVNLIYESLVESTLEDLRKRRTARRMSPGMGLFRRTRHAPAVECPVCQQMKQAGMNVLSSFMQALEERDSRLREAYLQSDGICLKHLRGWLDEAGDRFPRATDFVLEDTLERLKKYRAEMLEFIRKQNWEYREEPLTPEERRAWLKVLTLFTGLPAGRFDHHLPEF